MGKPEIITWAAIAEEAGLTRPIIIPDDLSPYDLMAIVNSLAARAIATAGDEGRAEQREVDAGIILAAEDWELGAFRDKGPAYLIQSVKSRMAILLVAAIRKGEP